MQTSDEELSSPVARRAQRRASNSRSEYWRDRLGFCTLGFVLAFVLVGLVQNVIGESASDALKEDASSVSSLSENEYNKMIAHKNVAEADLGAYEDLVTEPKIGEYAHTGVRKNMTVYHQTSREVCQSIMEHNFQIGRGGLCGRAVYFALSPEVTATKAITGNSHGGCMIEAVVDVGRQGYYYWNGGPDARFHESCGSWNYMTGAKLHEAGYDSIVMRQGDGDEIVIFEPERILARRILPFKCEWMCRGNCQRDWPSYCHDHSQAGGGGGGGGSHGGLHIRWPPPPPKIHIR